MSLPDQMKTEHGYELAYRLAGERLAGIGDIERQCLKGGARYQVIGSRKVIILDYLNQSYEITFPDVEISLTDSEDEVPLKDKILIVHYLAQATGTPVSNRAITYKELPEGTTYFPTFAKRAIKPIVDNFGRQPERLLEVAASLGGHRADYGDVAVTVPAFKQVPITFVLWRGDEEFPPEGNIIFDSTISEYLSTEDINVLCEVIAWRLVKLF